MSYKVETTFKNVWTPLDETGTLFGVKRHNQETLENYKGRILNSFIDKTNATYEGIVNSLLNEFQYKKHRAIRITLKNGVSHLDYPNRAIIKLDNRLLLCSRYDNLLDYTLDYSIELREKPYVSIYSLVNNINTFSSIFQAELILSDASTGPGTQAYWEISPAFTLLNNSSQKTIKEDFIMSTHFALGEYPIVPGSLLPTDETTYQTEVTELELLGDTPGNFYVNYETNVIVSVSIPRFSTNPISMIIHNEPFELLHSPIIISNLFTDDARRWLFEEIGQLKYTNDTDQTAAGHPKKFMVDLANELMGVARIYWGE